MKTRFSTLDIIAILPELKAKICTGWRVNQIFDCDYKTYLFRLNKSIVKMKKDDDPVEVGETTSNKMTLVIESGLRIHSTDYDWPKSHAPSGFAVKLRKHLRNKRIEDISQVGTDRVVKIQFGSNLAANYLIVELFDRGNLILTDNEFCILTLLRWRRPTDVGKSNKDPSSSNIDEDITDNIKVGDIYKFKESDRYETMTNSKIVKLLNDSPIWLKNSQSYKKRNKANQNKNDLNTNFAINLKDLLNPHVIYGGSLLEDKLLKHVSSGKTTKCTIEIPKDALGRLDQEKVNHYAKLIQDALNEAEEVLQEVEGRLQSPGYLVQKKLKQKDQNMKQDKNSEPKSVVTNIDFFPILTCAQRRVNQESDLDLQEFESFDKAVDVYYSNLESQKIDTQAFSAEKEVRKKLENLKLAQEKRLDDLARVQQEDEEKARLIEMNSDKVEDALMIIRSMLANQISWADIWKTIQEAQKMNDPVASLISDVKFDRDQFTMKLSDPYKVNGEDDNENCDQYIKKKKGKGNQKSNSFKLVDIDISLSAYANARRFFVKRRTAVNKEKKTIEVSKKAFKNVERRTKEMLKEVTIKTNITKARKRYWFENFFWFLSSDGYLVVAGRDAEQNELLVKRYMKKNDIYVHADLHGASSVIIKNEFPHPVPPKTLTEAGSMAVCYSSAWDSKIATVSWWVYPKQVSKTAPAGEYLTLGAFIIRGKKNYLPLSNLVLGFGFLFRLGEESVERRRDERLAREANRTEDIRDDTKKDVQDSDSDEDDSNEQDNDDGSSDKESGGKAVEIDNDDLAPDVKSEGESKNDDLAVVEDDGDDDVDDEDFDAEGDKIVEQRLVDTLSEFPAQDDILLYAIPMCGPYSALSSFKYKVKVVPGANKRGKAAKACLGMFIHDKKASQREKDLLRVLKDQDYARNIPNNVKISAANLKSIIKKKKTKKSEVRLPF